MNAKIIKKVPIKTDTNTTHYDTPLFLRQQALPRPTYAQ